MSPVISANSFQPDTERLLEKILESGMPLEIEYKGKKFLLNAREKDEPETAFWENKSLDELLQNTPISPVSDISDLASDFWPEDESADDFIDHVYQQRKENIEDRFYHA